MCDDVEDHTLVDDEDAAVEVHDTDLDEAIADDHQKLESELQLLNRVSDVQIVHCEYLTCPISFVFGGLNCKIWSLVKSDGGSGDGYPIAFFAAPASCQIRDR